MSGMNFLERLLDGVAVEWKTLGQICLKTSSGGTPLSTREDYYGGDIPWLRTQEVCFNEVYDTDIKITELAVKNSSAKWIPANCVIVAISGATAARSAINKIPLTTNQHCCNLEINPAIANYRYVFHWVLREYDRLKALGQGARADLNSGIIKSYQIPIPCPDKPDRSLAIQAEIVRILDTFTALTAELTAELAAELGDRKKQYNYYRDRLLTFEKGEVEWKTLGEIGKILRGTAITEKQTNPGDYPVVANGPSHNYFHDQSNRSGETIVIARSGVYAGLVSYWNIPIFLTDAFSIHPDNNALSTKFLYYVLKKDQAKIHNMSKGAGVPHVRAKEFESYKVPVLSLEEQARIVAILDKFDALTTDLREGLPREIALRQKQYEYYRDLLLTFPKAEEEQ